MKTQMHLLIALFILSLATNRTHAEDDGNPILEFAGSYLLGKAADAVWDSATGKPDIKELEARLTRLERLLGDASAPIANLRKNVTSNTSEQIYRDNANSALTALRQSVKSDPNELAHVYIGSVGKLKAVFSLNWGNDGKVTGVYCNPTRDASMIYSLVGANLKEGQLTLSEFTHDQQTARIILTKSISPGWIMWSGKMHNTDGRVLNVKFQRERK